MADDDAEVLAGTDVDDLRARVDSLQRQVDVIQAEQADDVWHDGKPSLLDGLHHMRGKGGIVVDEAVARETPCIAYALTGKEPDLYFSRGVVGALSETQREQFCPTVELREPSPAQHARIVAMQEAAKVCEAELAGVPEGERLEPWLACMAREMRSRGQRP